MSSHLERLVNQESLTPFSKAFLYTPFRSTESFNIRGIHSNIDAKAVNFKAMAKIYASEGDFFLFPQENFEKFNIVPTARDKISFEGEDFVIKNIQKDFSGMYIFEVIQNVKDFSGSDDYLYYGLSATLPVDYTAQDALALSGVGEPVNLPEEKLFRKSYTSIEINGSPILILRWSYESGNVVSFKINNVESLEEFKNQNKTEYQIVKGPEGNLYRYAFFSLEKQDTDLEIVFSEDNL